MPTLGDIIRRHGGEYLARHGASVPIEHRRVLALLGACRTGELGRVSWHCDGCGRSLQTPPDFFVPVKALSRILRAKFRDAMRHAGLLDQIAPAVWREGFITDSRAVGDGESTLRYLSRYVFRVAISNTRILALEAGRVRLRWKKSGSRRWRTMEVDALELLRRFLQHVLPPGLQKVRHYGYLSRQSAISLEDVRAIVTPANAAARDAIATASRHLDASSITAAKGITEPTCPHCRHRLRLVEILFHRVSCRDSG